MFKIVSRKGAPYRVAISNQDATVLVAAIPSHEYADDGVLLEAFKNNVHDVFAIVSEGVRLCVKYGCATPSGIKSTVACESDNYSFECSIRSIGRHQRITKTMLAHQARPLEHVPTATSH